MFRNIASRITGRTQVTLRTNAPHASHRWTALLTIVALTLGLMATSVLAAKPVNDIAIDLDQCRNGGLEDPQDSWQQCVTTGSGASGWVNGNAGASNAHFAEGESISYRARMTNLQVGDVVTLTMGYDVIHNGHDAIDYLTDKNGWQTPETSVGATPDIPCSGVSPAPADCAPLAEGGNPSLITITQPPVSIQVDTTKSLASGDCQKAGAGATQQPATSFNAYPAARRVMELFGGTGGTFAYFGPDPNLLDKAGNQEQQVQVTFTATAANPVLAWGGHIASRLDWGCTDEPQSASGISGSPYHMRIKSAVVNDQAISLGNQDRSLSASAVIFVQSALSTTPGGSANYDVTVTDILDVGVPTAGGTADFYLFDSLQECTDNVTPVFTALDQPVSNGLSQTITATNITGLNDLTGTNTFYWFVHYDGSSNPNVLPADHDCLESVTFTAPTVDADPPNE
jgi:hypothetical protein